MTLKEEILIEKGKRAFPFWGYSISILSVFYGVFILIYEDYMDGLFRELFDVIPDWTIAILLISSALIKLIGIHKENKKVMRIGIVCLSAVWTAITAVYLVYSFGVGYPNPSFLFMGFVTISCYKVAKKGDFG